MRPRAPIFVAFLLVALLAGCKDNKGPDPKAEAVAEAVQHIESAPGLVAPVSRLSEITPAHEVATTLRRFANDLKLWQNTYKRLRGKMVLRRVSRAQEADVSKRYNAAVDEIRLRVEQTERRITKRGDTQMFMLDLQRVRSALRDL